MRLGIHVGRRAAGRPEAATELIDSEAAGRPQLGGPAAKAVDEGLGEEWRARKRTHRQREALQGAAKHRIDLELAA